MKFPLLQVLEKRSKEQASKWKQPKLNHFFSTGLDCYIFYCKDKKCRDRRKTQSRPNDFSDKCV